MIDSLLQLLFKKTSLATFNWSQKWMLQCDEKKRWKKTVSKYQPEERTVSPVLDTLVDP